MILKADNQETGGHARELKLADYLELVGEWPSRTRVFVCSVSAVIADLIVVASIGFDLWSGGNYFNPHAAQDAVWNLLILAVLQLGFVFAWLLPPYPEGTRRRRIGRWIFPLWIGSVIFGAFYIVYLFGLYSAANLLLCHVSMGIRLLFGRGPGQRAAFVVVAGMLALTLSYALGLAPYAPFFRSDMGQIYTANPALLWRMCVAFTIGFAILYLLLDSILTRLRELAETDVLTGAVNRRRFIAKIEEEFLRSRRSGSALSLVLVDLDHFKRVNDELGHLEGDRVLKRAVELLKRQVRSYDTVARYGGEEFAILLPGAGADRAADVAERCRRAFAEDRSLRLSETMKVTASLGVADLSRGQFPNIDGFIHAADTALYRAKNAGRNAVAVFATVIALLWLPAAAKASPVPANYSMLPVVIRGSAAGPLLGQSASRLVVVACSASSMRIIPFQIDEWNNSGDLMVSGNGPMTKPDEAPGVIDETDELVFMLKDADEACPPERLGRATGQVVEIRITAGTASDPRYAYAMIANDQVMAPVAGYVRYRPESDEAGSDAFTWTFNRTRPHLIEQLSFNELGPATGRNLLDRMRIRFTSMLLGKSLRLRFTEDDVSSRLLAVRAGPVRVIRQIELRVSPVPGYSISSRLTHITYERLAELNSTFRVPAAAALFTSSMDVEASLDFLDLRGAVVATKMAPGGVRVDGEMLPQEEQLELGEEPWFLVSKGNLNVFGVSQLDSRIEVRQTAVFTDSLSASDPPENAKGMLPRIGYEWKGWEKISAGTYTLNAKLLVLNSPPDGGSSSLFRALTGQVISAVRSASVAGREVARP